MTRVDDPVVSWSDSGADPIADIQRWREQIAAASHNGFNPNVVWISVERWMRVVYGLRRAAIGKPWSKRSWRRFRAGRPMGGIARLARR